MQKWPSMARKHQYGPQNKIKMIIDKKNTSVDTE